MDLDNFVYDDNSSYEDGTNTHSHLDSTSYMEEDSDADSDYNPDPYTPVGDSCERNDKQMTEHLLNSCLNMLNSKLSSINQGSTEPNPGTPSIDCDAFSFIVTAEPPLHSCTLDSEQRQAIKRFLYVFAQPLSTVTFPLSEVAANKPDSLFGSSKNKCQHVESVKCADLLVSDESLVISAPVKLAVHNSCRENVARFLNKNQGLPAYLELSPNENICFNPHSHGNLPCYESVIEAILSSCYVPDQNKFVIHVANLGTRYPIQAREDENNPCQVRRIFDEVDRLRECGIDVETTQLDIAFNFSPEQNLLQWSQTRYNKPNKKIPSVFRKCNNETWAIHDVKCTTNNGLIKCIPTQQRGTVRLRQKNWKTPYNSNLEDHYQVYYDGGYDDNDDGGYLEYNENWSDVLNSNFKGTKINHNSIHSVKLYPTISHIMRNQKVMNVMPMSLSKMANLHTCTFRKLQLMLNSMQVKFNKAAQIITNYGICARTEISIRPGIDMVGSYLRLQGTFVDVMLHVHVALNDLFFQERKLSLHHMQIDPVRSKLFSLVAGVEPYVKMRSALRFCDLHSARVQQWLQCMMNLIMSLGGLASNFNLKYVSKWLTDLERHDPTGQATLLQTNFLNIHSDAEIIVAAKTKPTIPNTVLQELNNLLKNNGISRVGSARVLEYMQQDPNPDPNSCADNLSHKDLLFLADSCHDLRVQLVSLKNLKDTNYVQETEAAVTRRGSYQGDNWLINHIREMDPSILEYRRPKLFESSSFLESTLKLTQGRNHQHPRMNNAHKWPEDPYLMMILLIEELTQPFDPQDQFYIHRLYHHICLCHNQSLVLRNQQALVPFPQDSAQPTTSFAISGKILHNLNSSYKDLLNLCYGLNVHTANSRTKFALIARLATHYYYPCQVGNPDFASYNLLSITTQDRLCQAVHSSLQEDFVLEIEYHNTTQNHFYRSKENLNLFIISKEYLVTEASSGEHDILLQSNDLYHVLDTCFIHQSRSGNDSRIAIRNCLIPLKKLSQYFLTEMALPNASFLASHCLDQLEESKNFSLLPTGTQDAFNKICPEIILPAASLAFKVNIFFQDHVKLQSYLHVYIQTYDKVITYQFDCLSVSPIVDCHAFVLREGIYMSIRFPTEPHHVYDIFTQPKDFSTEYCTTTRTLKRHPSGTPIGTPSLSQAIISLLQSNELNHKYFSAEEEGYQTEDPFYLFDYLGELNSFFADQELKSFVSPEVLGIWEELTPGIANINDLVQHFYANDLHSLHHSFVCTLLCLKYKLWFAIWENKDQHLSTYFYYFNSHRNVVEVHICDNYVYKQRDLMYLYIKYSIHNGRISTGYWRAPVNNPFSVQSTCFSGMLLCTPYSYLDGPEFTYLVKQMVECLGMNLHLNKPITHPVTQGRILPTVLIQRILQDDIILIDHLLGVFYPPAPPKQEKCMVLFISSSREDLFNSSIQSVIESIGHEHRHQYDFKSLHIPRKSYFSSLFMLSIYMYAALKCSDSNILGSVINDLHNQFDFLKRAKYWVSYVITNEIQVTTMPTWLQDSIQRNIN